MSENKRVETIFKYKGYSSQLYYSDEDDLFYGKIDGISDLVSYEGETMEEAEKVFEDAVDEYLWFKEEIKRDVGCFFFFFFSVFLSIFLRLFLSFGL